MPGPDRQRRTGTLELRAKWWCSGVNRPLKGRGWNFMDIAEDPRRPTGAAAGGPRHVRLGRLTSLRVRAGGSHGGVETRLPLFLWSGRLADTDRQTQTEDTAFLSEPIVHFLPLPGCRHMFHGAVSHACYSIGRRALHPAHY